MKPLRALIVEDSDDDAALLLRELQQGGYEPVHARVQTAESMKQELFDSAWDIVFSDFSMPYFNAFDALALLRSTGLDLPFIIVSGTIGEDRAVMAMKSGAHDYILKGNLKRLVPAVDRELREAQIREERRRAEAVVHHLAYVDPVTQLPNRARFLEQVEEAVQAGLRDEHLVALLLMDLDRFKEVNDTLGHDYGDDLLQQVGVRLRQALLPSDTVARLGGDEFGILLPHLASHEAIDPVIRALHDSLDVPFMMDNIPIAVEASMGVALMPEHADSANVLMQRADIALYRAKGLASDYTVYSPRFSPQSPEWLGLMAELRDGLEQNQLRLYFQPKLDIRTGRITGCEALVRWQHPRHGLILPNRFILVAEQTGLIGPLTEWVVIEALKSCQELCHSQIQVKMSVNLSARSLHDTRLLQMIAQAIEAAGARPEQLMLEVTESAIVLDPQRAKENLLALSQMGVALSIDDFGTGYTSLASIKQLPVNEIKIDQSFVTNMLSDPKDAMIVRTVIDLGHNFGMTVVAEGVETRDVLNALGALDCDGVQGYFIGRPQPGPLLGQWLAESPWIAGSAGQAG